MSDRRTFLKTLAVASAAAPLVRPAGAAAEAPGVRASWVALLTRIARPVLRGFADERIRETMPVEAAAGAEADRRNYTYLEALGRTLTGAAPWLAVRAPLEREEAGAREELANLARVAVARATDPGSPAYVNFSTGGQPLVDAAFLAHAIVRAPDVLWEPLSTTERQRVVAALHATRVIRPPFNNWLLFAAMVEAALARVGASWDALRVDYALRQHDQWYKGDGIYGDGPSLHWDYYNAYVIQPMLVDVLAAVGETSPAWRELATRVHDRARRYAAIQERLIAPDGSFPPIGRSLAYRCGAFQALAQSALRHDLPAGVTPAQVRGALDAVIHRTLDAPATFDDHGWLRIGLAGHQPGVGERYISTGSLYLCTAAFLPLGLPPDDPFWSAADAPWTAVRAWSGQPIDADHALD